jgi:ribose transport system substrate-binding protein
MAKRSWILVLVLIPLLAFSACAPQPTAPAEPAEPVVDTAAIEEAEAQIADLEAQLADAEASGEASAEELAVLQAQLEEAQAAAAEAQAAAEAAAAAAAGPDDTAGLSLEGKTIGVAIVGTDHFWDREAFNSALATVEELGGTAIGVDAERDDQKHVANHENLMAQEPDAIISILGSGELMEPVFQQISEAGIPLFTVDHPSPYSINNSTSDNYYMGVAIGRIMASELGFQGRVAIFHGFGAVDICRIRYDMWRYVIDDTDIEVIEPFLQDVVPNTQEDARQKVADLLQQYPEGELDAIHVACWDIPAIGAVQAIEEAGRTDVKVFGLDAGPETLEILMEPDSPLAGDVAQLPALIARTSVLNVARYLAGEEVPPTSYVDVIPVTKDNAAQVIEELGY